MSKPLSIARAAFVMGSPDGLSLPETDLPEVAILGRSNVGKSSLINRLCKNSKLARVSNTPGRTQQLNLFRCALAIPAKKLTLEFHLVDFPGFGFAKFSKDQREEVSRSVVDYASERKQLRLVLMLNDSKRLPEDDEWALQRLAFERDVHFAVIATKCDRLKPKELSAQLRAIATAYHLMPEDLIISGEGISDQPLLTRIAALITD